MNIKLPKIIAHYGASGYAPENTLAAMRKAVELGATWVAFEVRLTANEELIVICDETLERTTNGSGKIVETQSKAISKLDAGSWFDKKFAGEHVPTLLQLLDYLRKNHLNIILEMRPVPGRGRDSILIEKVINVLHQHWPLQHALPLLVSESESVLAGAAIKAPTLPRGFMMNTWQPSWNKQLNDLRCVALFVNHELLNVSRVTAVKSAGYLLLAYTVNDVMRAKELISWGVDAVCSGYPDLLKS